MGMNVKKVLQDGSVFDAAVLELSSASILAKFKAAVAVQALLSLGAGYATSASVPHSLGNGFKNLVAVSAMTGYEFPQAKKILRPPKAHQLLEEKDQSPLLQQRLLRRKSKKKLT